MVVQFLFCPLCGDTCEFVDSERKPQVVRCEGCGMGWELLATNNSLMMSQARSFSKPELKLHEPTGPIKNRGSTK